KPSGRQRRQLPTSIAQLQLAVTARLARGAHILPRQSLDYAYTFTAQALYGLPQVQIVMIRRPDPGGRLVHTHVAEGDQGLQIGGETGGRARPTEITTDIIVAAA